LPRYFLTIRADKSTPPPAGEALMILIGRFGKLASGACALAGPDSKMPTSPSNPK
jgi:hypothetical protein